jgi:hypothetical protein
VGQPQLPYKTSVRPGVTWVLGSTGTCLDQRIFTVHTNIQSVDSKDMLIETSTCVWLLFNAKWAILQQYHTWNLTLPPVFSWICVAWSLVYCVMFCRSLFVLFLNVYIYHMCWPECNGYSIMCLKMCNVHFCIHVFPLFILPLI